MGVKSITDLKTLVFCACTGLLFFASVTSRLHCYHCSFYQDFGEECECRLNPSAQIGQKICKWVQFPQPRQSKNNHEKETTIHSSERRGDVDVCEINLKIDARDNRPGIVDLHRKPWFSYTDPDRRTVNITSKCNLDAALLTPANKNIVCHCDTDYCNGQPFDFPDLWPRPTTATKRPCPPTTTITPTTTRKSTTTPGTATTPCVPNPPTPESVTSSAFNHPDDNFAMHKYWILCHTMSLLIGSCCIPGSGMFKFK